MTGRLMFAAMLVIILAMLFSEISLGDKECMQATPAKQQLPATPSLLPRSIQGSPGGNSLPGGVSRTLTLHYAPWCGACSNYRPTWEQMKATVTIRGLYFQENNEQANPTPGIDSYPTITALDEWGRTHVFRGDRSIDRVIAWVSTPVIVG